MPFEQRTLDFLFHNKKNNSKQWYASHKEDFKKYVYAPLEDMVIQMTPTMLSIDERFITQPRTDYTISRIYRDCRFSQDKSLYRDHMWLTFMQDKKMYTGLPGFFFEISPYGFRYGCGYYHADGASMRSFRKLIADNTPVFQKAFECYKSQNIFTFEAERLKRSLYPDLPCDVQDWLMRKDVNFIANSTDIDMLFSKELPQIIAEQFKMIKPLYELMMHAEVMK